MEDRGFDLSQLEGMMKVHLLVLPLEGQVWATRLDLGGKCVEVEEGHLTMHCEI